MNKQMCQECKGAGTVKALTHGRGPDDYEIDVECPACSGSGEEKTDSAQRPSTAATEPVAYMNSKGNVMSAAEYHRHQTTPDWKWVIRDHWTPVTPLYAGSAPTSAPATGATRVLSSAEQGAFRDALKRSTTSVTGATPSSHLEPDHIGREANARQHAVNAATGRAIDSPAFTVTAQEKAGDTVSPLESAGNRTSEMSASEATRTEQMSSTPLTRSAAALPANIRKALEGSNLPIEQATAIADLCEGLSAPSATLPPDEREALIFFVGVSCSEGFFDDDDKTKELVRAWLLDKANGIRDDITVEDVVKSLIGRVDGTGAKT